MEEKQYNLCLEVLRRFNKHGLLSEFILIGSWCLVFYKKYFADPDYARRVSLITRDMDFLVNRPQTVKATVDIPELLKDLGFVTTFKGQRGHMKLDHPELILEFLAPARGRGRSEPVRLPSLHVSVTELRFLNFLSENTIEAEVEDFSVHLPHPVNFGLHKLIISPRRPTKDKAIKDNDAAVLVLRTLINNREAKTISGVFRSTPKTWQKKILEALQEADEPQILEVLEGT